MVNAEEWSDVPHRTNDDRVVTTADADEREVEQALIEEARRFRRRRQRWIQASLAVVLLAAVAYGIGHRDNATRSKTTENPNVSSVAASTPRCSLSQLMVTSDRGGWHANYAAAGEFRETLTFTNVSRRACQLSGWPRVHGVVESTPMTRVRQNAPSSPVRLAPRKTASFDIYGADWNPIQNKACPQTTTSLLVSPPGDSKSVLVTVEEPECGGFDISPVISGSNDRQSWSTTVQ